MNYVFLILNDYEMVNVFLETPGCTLKAKPYAKPSEMQFHALLLFFPRDNCQQALGGAASEDAHEENFS